MNVSRLFVLDWLLSVERADTKLSAHNGQPTPPPPPPPPPHIINGELYSTYGKGTWGGGVYYLEGAGCMLGNTV